MSERHKVSATLDGHKVTDRQRGCTHKTCPVSIHIFSPPWASLWHTSPTHWYVNSMDLDSLQIWTCVRNTLPTPRLSNRHILRHDKLLHDIIKGKMLDKGTCARKTIEWLHDMMEGRDYWQLKDLISDRSRWRQDSKWERMSETCWKQHRTKERTESNRCSNGPPWRRL